MKLTAAATYFDRLPVYDAYSNKELFEAQFDLFDDSKRDAVNIMRRTLSVAPLTSMPARLAIKAASQHWIVGRNPNNDTFMRGLIRTKYTVQLAHGLALLRTAGEVITNTGGSAAYAGLAWMKDWKEVEYSSRVYPYYEVYFAYGEPLTPDQFIELDGKIFRSRGVYLSEAGFQVVEADDLQTARVSVSYTGPTTYDPSTDTFSGSTSTVPALNVRYAADFLYEQPSVLKRQPGDLVLLVRKTDVSSPKPDDGIVFSSKSYKVISVESESDCWNLTVRP